VGCPGREAGARDFGPLAGAWLSKTWTSGLDLHLGMASAIVVAAPRQWPPWPMKDTRRSGLQSNGSTGAVPGVRTVEWDAWGGAGTQDIGHFAVAGPSTLGPQGGIFVWGQDLPCLRPCGDPGHHWPCRAGCHGGEWTES